MLVRHSTASGQATGADLRRNRVGAGQPDRCVGEREPTVGLFGEERAEAKGTGQGQMGGLEACHHVPGTTPPIDGLGGVADHH